MIPVSSTATTMERVKTVERLRVKKQAQVGRAKRPVEKTGSPQHRLTNQTAGPGCGAFKFTLQERALLTGDKKALWGSRQLTAFLF